MTQIDGASGPSRRHAVTLIEAVLFVAVALTLILGGLVFFQQARTSQQTASTIRLVQALVAEGRWFYRNGDLRAPRAEAIDITEILIKSGGVPSSYVNTEDLSWLRTAWGGKVEVHSIEQSDIFPVLENSERVRIGFYEGLPVRICTRLAVFDSDGVGIIGDGVSYVRVGALHKATSTVFVSRKMEGLIVDAKLGASPGDAAEACRKRAASLDQSFWGPDTIDSLTIHFIW